MNQEAVLATGQAEVVLLSHQTARVQLSEMILRVLVLERLAFNLGECPFAERPVRKFAAHVIQLVQFGLMRY